MLRAFWKDSWKITFKLQVKNSKGMSKRIKIKYIISKPRRKKITNLNKRRRSQKRGGKINIEKAR